MRTAPPFDPSQLDPISSEHYERNGYPFAEWAWLRQHDPVSQITRPGYDPFWAITKHADIIELSKQPNLFLNEPRLAVFNNRIPPPPEATIRHLLNMDPPDHGKYRNVAAKRFTPRAVQSWAPKVERITQEVLDDCMAKPSGDFVQDISARITIAVIAEMLGVPASDRGLLFRWTNEVIAPEDPEYQTGGNPEETLEKARMELFLYFDALSKDRQRNPQDDIVSVVAGGAVDGAALGPVELLSYYLLLVVAGNETTRNAMTGGMLAFLENPGEWAKLRQNPDLLDLAVEEIVRWTTPVIQFCRTATRDYPLREKVIRTGESACLFYPSANRDEEVFGDPFAFRVDRRPNPHLAFGVGEHFCMGAHLARLELETMFRHLLARLYLFEPSGPVERLSSAANAGLKHLPLRYRLA